MDIIYNPKEGKGPIKSAPSICLSVCVRLIKHNPKKFFDFVHFCLDAGIFCK